MYVMLFFAELFVLFLLSRHVQRSVGHFLLKIFRNKKLAVYIMAILFLPGTFVHEISHFLFALFLLVPVGEMELMPKIEADSIKLGSVKIAQTDPIRRFLVGVAPFLLGTLVILTLVYQISKVGQDKSIWVLIAVGYAIFTISNTMFMSKKDLEGSWLFLGVVFFVGVLLWVFGLNIEFNLSENGLVLSFFKNVYLFLLMPLVLDIIALAALKKL